MIDKKIKKLDQEGGFEGLKDEETELLLRRKKAGRQEEDGFWDSA